MATNINGNGPTMQNEVEVPTAVITPDSPEGAVILDAIRKLRELGVDRKYDLPQIIVCGAQSAGKSSVLESLVQVPFPRGSDMCTRNVTMVTMQPADVLSIEVRIQPGENRLDGKAESLRKFHRWDDSKGSAAKLARYMQEAHQEIFSENDESTSISQDIMLVTVKQPGAWPLQVLDLPGLIEYHQKSSDTIYLIEKMVTRYMSSKQSIILAVIGANEDLNNQKVLKLCKEHDQLGERTIGVFTRPDVSVDAQKRKRLIAVMNNHDKDFQFQHSWHVLRNRASEEADTSQEERDEKEKDLFRTWPWNTIDPSSLGIAELRKRLAERLFGLAKKELPSLRQFFHRELRRLEGEHKALGGDEFKEGELQKAVEQSLKRLRVDALDHARGAYWSNIRHAPRGSPLHLRARVNDVSEVFRDSLVARGHAYNTLIRPTAPDPDSDLVSVYREEEGPEWSRSFDTGQNRFRTLDEEIYDEAKDLEMKRGQNLPTFHDPKLIHEKFWKMSDGWTAIAEEFIQSIYSCCDSYFREVAPIAFRRPPGKAGLGFLNAEKVAARFVDSQIVSRLDSCRESALEELGRLETDRLDAPINFDVRFLKDRRSYREGREFERAMKAYHRVTSASDPSRLDQTAYAEHAGLHSMHDQTADTAANYLNAMWSHYLVCILLPQTMDELR